MSIKALYIGAYLGVLIGFTVQWTHYKYLKLNLQSYYS